MRGMEVAEMGIEEGLKAIGVETARGEKLGYRRWAGKDPMNCGDQLPGRLLKLPGSMGRGELG